MSRLDTKAVHWDLVTPSHGRRHSVQLDLLQAESVTPTDASIQSVQKAAASICSERRRALRRPRTRLDQGRSAVQRVRQTTNRSMHQANST